MHGKASLSQGYMPYRHERQTEILIPRKNQDVSPDVGGGTTPRNDVEPRSRNPAPAIRIYCRAKEIEGGTRRRDLRRWQIYGLGEPACQMCSRKESMAIPLSGKALLNEKMTPYNSAIAATYVGNCKVCSLRENLCEIVNAWEETCHSKWNVFIHIKQNCWIIFVLRSIVLFDKYKKNIRFKTLVSKTFAHEITVNGGEKAASHDEFAILTTRHERVFRLYGIVTRFYSPPIEISQ